MNTLEFAALMNLGGKNEIHYHSIRNTQLGSSTQCDRPPRRPR